MPNFAQQDLGIIILKCCVSSVVVTLRAIFGGEPWLTDTPHRELYKGVI